MPILEQLNDAAMKTPYEPIACALHDEYESAITLRQQLLVGWIDDAGVTHKEVVLPLDLRVSEGEEFLIMRLETNVEESADVGKEVTIRLDRVTLFGHS